MASEKRIQESDNTVSDRPARGTRGQRLCGEEAVSGVVHAIRDELELNRFREGEILVAREIPVEWSHLFCLAKGIITESMVAPPHLTEAALEFSLPVITGVPEGADILRSGDIIMMHIDGTIEWLDERRAPDSKMRVSVPAAVHARQFAGSDDVVAERLSGDVVSFPTLAANTNEQSIAQDASTPVPETSAQLIQVHKLLTHEKGASYSELVKSRKSS